MKKVSRREALSGVFSTGTTLLALNNLDHAQTQPVPKVFAGKLSRFRFRSRQRS